MTPHSPVDKHPWPSREYRTPEVEILRYTMEGIVCESPNDGESEDVEYEDWN